MKRYRLGVLCSLFVAAVGLVRAEAPAAAPAPVPPGKVFYVYAPKSTKEVNHYTPSGWMGDVGDLRYEEAHLSTKAGDTAIKISYSAKGTKGAGWAGIYWQNPNNNWGARAGGYNLSKFKKLIFQARSAKGGERINEFKMGGISGAFGDTDSAVIGPIQLTKDWKTYTVDLAGKDLSRIIGGFCFSAAREDNPDGFTLFLNNIRYE